MKKIRTFLSGILAGLTSASCASAMADKSDISHDAPPGMEKCYGVRLGAVNGSNPVNPTCGALGSQKIADHEYIWAIKDECGAGKEGKAQLDIQANQNDKPNPWHPPLQLDRSYWHQNGSLTPKGDTPSQAFTGPFHY